VSLVPRERVKRERCAPRPDCHSGGKSAAAPATVSGESLARPPSSGLEQGESLSPPRHGKTGPEALTREPGDLPASRSQQLPGGVPWRWETIMAAIPAGGLRRASQFQSNIFTTPATRAWRAA
jgi:hypothetical protein